jgi:Sulfatase
VYLPSGRRWALDDRPLDGYKEGHWLTSWAALEGEQRYLLQLGYTDRALGLILRKLRQAGIYDRALVIVTGDEGESFRGDDQRRRATPTNMDDIAFVPLFVKLPGQKQGRFEDGLAPSIDILPTIARVLHVPIPWRIDGRSLVGRKLPANGPVSVARDVGEITRPLAELRAMRKRTLAEQLATFGSGTFDQIYRIGPNPKLIGRKVSSLTVRPSPRIAVSLDGRSYLAAVDPATDFLPSHVSGAVTGARGAQLDLAIAVNGTIASVTRTHLDHGQTRFATFVPESSLRPGSNSVDLFAVRRSGRGLVLEELRGGDLELVLRGGEIVSAQGKRIRIDASAIAGTVQVAKTAGGYAFKGRAATRKGHQLVDSIAVFADSKGIFAGNANDLRPLRFLDKGSLDKSRFRFELPRSLLPGEGQDHQVRVFAIRGRVASELAYRGAYPWAHG